MLPTAERLNLGIQKTLEEQILPDLSSPYPKFLARISMALTGHLALRAQKETRILVDSNDQMRTTARNVLDELATCGADIPERAEVDRVLGAARERDAYCSAQSLTDENVDLRGVLVSLLALLASHQGDIPEAQAKAMNRSISSCAYDVLKRDYELVADLAEFQKTLYNMD